MFISPLNACADALAAAVAAASTAYCLLSTIAALRFVAGRRHAVASSELPLVSILKPLKGADANLYAALRSHCVLDYPQYEILFGITEPTDPAAAVAQKLAHEFPEVRIRLIRCDKRLGANGKVSTLIQLAAAASHEHLVVNDGDIQVDPDYLRTVISELQQPQTGLVTCLYRAVPAATLSSHLEAAGISTDFAPGVLTANLLERGIHFGLGSTLAFRKRELQAIGGFEMIVDYLADDYELGARIAQTGLKVRLSSSVVETHLPPYDLDVFVAHQLRWARTIRASRPGGYVGLLLTFTLPWALAALICSRGALWATALFGAALVCRVIMAIVSSQLVLRERSLTSLLLFPTRDFIAVAIWIAGLFGKAITWQGERFVLGNGKLKPK